MDLLKDKFKDYINIDNSSSFEEIIQSIVVQLEQQKQLNENVPLGKYHTFFAS